MKVFINFANEKFAKQQKLALKTARIIGGFDKVIGYTPEDIDGEFYKKNKIILSQKKGAGLWLWKPYFILKTLNMVGEGDFVFYLDSGYFMTKNADKLMGSLEKSGQDIMSFSTYYPEEQWTKKKLFEKMDCVSDNYIKTNQFMATMCLVKNTPRARRFISTWLELACDFENIADAGEGESQSPKFIEHRHDQSIFSLLCKKEGFLRFRAPYVFAEKGAAWAVKEKTAKVYGRLLDFDFQHFENSNYPTMLQVYKPFKFLGAEMNLFIVAYAYLKLLNVLPFGSRAYNTLLNLGIRGL